MPNIKWTHDIVRNVSTSRTAPGDTVDLYTVQEMETYLHVRHVLATAANARIIIAPYYEIAYDIMDFTVQYKNALRAYHTPITLLYQSISEHLIALTQQVDWLTIRSGQYHADRVGQTTAFYDLVQCRTDLLRIRVERT